MSFWKVFLVEEKVKNESVILSPQNVSTLNELKLWKNLPYDCAPGFDQSSNDNNRKKNLKTKIEIEICKKIS